MREPHKLRIELRKKKYREQKGICVYCNEWIQKSNCSLDHIIPVQFLDKLSHIDNLVMCCKRCNKKKSNHIVFSLLDDGLIYPIINVYPFNKKWRIGK